MLDRHWGYIGIVNILHHYNALNFAHLDSLHSVQLHISIDMIRFFCNPLVIKGLN